MPSRCCVTNCQGNYDSGPRVTVFSFPKDTDLKKKWIAAIPRKDFVPSKSSRVCELHFSPSSIERETSSYDTKTGQKITAKLQHPRLSSDAIPSIFPGCPTYFTSASTSRESPEDKRQRMENEALKKALEISKKENEAYKALRNFSSLKELLRKLQRDCPSPKPWEFIEQDNKILFYIIEVTTTPRITASLVISNDLVATAFLGDVSLKCIKNVLNLPSKLNDIDDLFLILHKIHSLLVEPKNSNVQDIYLESIEAALLNLKDHVDSEILPTLIFITEQLKLLFKKKQNFSYSPDTLIFASLLYSISPHCYKFLRSSENVILPHPSTIRRICSRYEMNPKHEQSDVGFLKYMKYKFNLLEKNDRTVILMMDEIHIKPFLEYKSGSIFGMGYQNTNAATTAYVFMIGSLLSSYKDVVHILPVNKMCAENLFNFLMKIILGLESIGFKVVCVVSDNNSINRKAMTFFASPPKLSIAYQHPYDNTRPLFFCLDTVHLIKCIRNNWINQKNNGQCFFYPEFESLIVKILTASFQTLKVLHQHETGGILKYGFGLSLKALNPSNLERQNVKLALKVFSPFVAQGLLELQKKQNFPHASTTSEFITLICKWFDIVNVKTPHKGKRLKNIYQEPLTVACNDEKYVFLNAFLNWLDLWKSQNYSTGTLSKETHSALSHTTHALIEMARYCIEDLKFSYFLPGKVQTDALEDRFGKYRQLSGSQYHVGVTQIFESEAKIRIQDSLPLTLKSSTFGNVFVSEFQVIDIDPNDDFNFNFNNTFFITVEEQDLSNLESVYPLLTYLAGYCVYKLLRKLKCEHCSMNLTVDKILMQDDEACNYIQSLDRGGLLYPHSDIRNAVAYNYVVVQKLLSHEHEYEFIQVKDQASIACGLTYDALLEAECLSFDECEEGHRIELILKYILRASTNTFLKNYCCDKNDKRPKKKEKKRKLETLVS